MCRTLPDGRMLSAMSNLQELQLWLAGGRELPPCSSKPLPGMIEAVGRLSGVTRLELLQGLYMTWDLRELHHLSGLHRLQVVCHSCCTNELVQIMHPLHYLWAERQTTGHAMLVHCHTLYVVCTHCQDASCICFVRSSIAAVAPSMLMLLPLLLFDIMLNPPTKQSVASKLRPASRHCFNWWSLCLS